MFITGFPRYSLEFFKMLFGVAHLATLHFLSFWIEPGLGTLINLAWP